jgi:hypothetical protein
MTFIFPSFLVPDRAYRGLGAFQIFATLCGVKYFFGGVSFLIQKFRYTLIHVVKKFRYTLIHMVKKFRYTLSHFGGKHAMEHPGPPTCAHARPGVPRPA